MSSILDRAVRYAAARVVPVIIALFVLAIVTKPAAAQIGTTTQIITGRVVGPDSLPLAGAHIDVTSVETGVVRHALTKNDGRFSMLFRDGGAQYRVKITYIGMAPATLTLARQADEDRLVAEVHLARTAVALSAVQVRATNSRPGAAGASNAGGSERSLPTQLLERLPVGVGDLAAIAALSPGVIPVSSTDSTPASFSVAGQPANQNNVTVDGSSFLFGTLPQDAVKSVRVVTNAYDVSRGQFTGGQVATTTKGGTSEFQGTATANRQEPSLQFPTSTSPTFGQKYTQTTASFGVGGPLLGENSFYFGSLQYDRRSDAVASLLDASSGALTNLGASSDSVTRFLQLIGRDGLSGRAGAPATRTAATTSALARIDWDLGESHSLMLRGDFRHLSQDATRIAPLALPQTGGSSSSNGGGVMATLTSSLGNFINEGRAYASTDQQSTSAFLTGPLGVVTVASDLGNGASGISSLQFGGNSSLPRSSKTRLLEISDEVSWLQSESHRIKLGGLVNATRSTVGGINNRYGTFLYNSLADFDAGHPALYARTLSGVDQLSGSNNAAVYIGDAWRKTPSLQFVYGLRAEVTTLPGAPSENAKVEQAFGRRTDSWPTDTRVTPRLGFTYLLGNTAGLSDGVLKGGIGEFRGTVPSPLVGAVRNGTGLAGTQSQLLCVGPAAPTPDWSSYLANPGSIPSACLGGAQPTFSSSQPTVILFDNSFGAPDVWRASLGYTRRFRTTWALTVDGLFAYGLNSAYGTDINLPAPSFALASEGGRPVYARRTDIVPATGAIGALVRPHSDFGTVLTLGSGLRSRTGQLSSSLTFPGLRSIGYTTVAYTYNRVIDQSNGYALGSYIPTTAGDPNTIEWGTSDLERRHQFLATVFTPFSHGFDVSLVGRLLSGPRYTPTVNGDVNGDGARNDRAFVPTSGSSADFTRLLATTDSRAADCLQAQLGRIAGRNTCSTPWTPQLDVQLNWAPRAARLDDRLTVSLVASNTLAGVDHLLHGSAIHGWGQPVIPDRTLLSVNGFDQTSGRYVYRINQHFGTPSGAASAFIVPFQVGLRAHVLMGTDPQKAQLKAITGGGANGAAASAQEVKDRILKTAPYPIQQLLDSADVLKLDLTRDQRAKLDRVATAYRNQLDSVGTIIANMLVAAGPRPDMVALAPKIQAANLGVIKTLQQSVKDAEAVLTKEQWEKVPARIKLPLQAPPPAPKPSGKQPD